MRIALILPGGVDRSGTHRVIPCLLWLIERLAKAGHDVQVFVLRQEARPGRWKLLGATVHNAGIRPRSLFCAAQMLHEHRRERFDVIHAFWAQPCGAIGAIVSRLTGVPMVLTLPGGDAVHLSEIGYGGMATWRGRWMWELSRRAAITTVPSDAMVGQIQPMGIDARVVPLGVALDRWPVRAPRRRDPGERLRLVHVASLNRVKDQTTLLHAAARLLAAGLSFQLAIVGEDTLAGEIQRLTHRLGLDNRVTFEPFTAHADLHRRFAEADLLVMSSRHEAGPLVLLEAAIVGIPTVGTAVGHIADYAPVAARAVPVGDAAALADAVASVANDEPLRLQLAQAAQARALTMDADRTAALFGGIYADVTRGILR